MPISKHSNLTQVLQNCYCCKKIFNSVHRQQFSLQHIFGVENCKFDSCLVFSWGSFFNYIDQIFAHYWPPTNHWDWWENSFPVRYKKKLHTLEVFSTHLLTIYILTYLILPTSLKNDPPKMRLSHYNVIENWAPPIEKIVQIFIFSCGSDFVNFSAS